MVSKRRNSHDLSGRCERAQRADEAGAQQQGYRLIDCERREPCRGRDYRGRTVRRHSLAATWT
jgi:hypothetical protein